MNNPPTSLTPDNLLETKQLYTAPFYREIRLQVESKIPELNLGKPYTLRQICGKDFWDLLEKGQKISAGTYVAFLVTAKQLPLIPCGKSGDNSRLYKRE